MGIDDIVKELIAVFNSNNKYGVINANDFKSMLSDFVKSCVNVDPICDLHVVECCFEALFVAKEYIIENSTNLTVDELEEFNDNILAINNYIRKSVNILTSEITKVVNTQKEINTQGSLGVNLNAMTKEELIEFVKKLHK